MSLYNALDKLKHFGEFADPGYVEGVLKTPAERVALALANLGMAPMTTGAGAGITGGTGTVYKSAVYRMGGVIKTEIMIDLTGCSSSTTDTDIIGRSTTPAHIGQITAAQNGTILYGRMTCFEVPLTGADDIELWAATEGTGVYNGLVTDLAETAITTHAGAWAVDTPSTFSGIPAANKYLYLACGEAGTAGEYSAGKFLIEMWGYDA